MPAGPFILKGLSNSAFDIILKKSEFVLGFFFPDTKYTGETKHD